MSGSSELGYYTELYNGNLGTDYPVSAAVSRYMVNNLRHLIDQSAQVRVNWVAWKPYAKFDADLTDTITTTDARGISWYSADEWYHVTTFVFPVSIIGKDSISKTYRNPVNLVISVAGYLGHATTLTLRAVVQSVFTPYSADLDDDQCLAVIDEDTTATSSEWIIDGATTSLYPENVMFAVRSRGFTSYEYDMKNYDVNMYFMRLSIYAYGGEEEYKNHLTGVYVREYQV